jgi:hypothetical protein
VDRAGVLVAEKLEPREVIEVLTDDDPEVLEPYPADGRDELDARDREGSTSLKVALDQPGV